MRRTAGAYASVAGLLLDRSTLVRELIATASTDPLTGCLNYAGLRESLQREMQRSKRHGYRFTICLADLYGFGDVNDRSGHIEGDHRQAGAAGALRAHLRSSDWIGRSAQTST